MGQIQNRKNGVPKIQNKKKWCAKIIPKSITEYHKYHKMKVYLDVI